MVGVYNIMKFNRNRKKRGVTNPDKFYIGQQFRNFYKIKNSFSFNTRTYTYNNFVFIAETEVASEFICFFFIDNKSILQLLYAGVQFE